MIASITQLELIFQIFAISHAYQKLSNNLFGLRSAEVTHICTYVHITLDTLSFNQSL